MKTFMKEKDPREILQPAELSSFMKVPAETTNDVEVKDEPLEDVDVKDPSLPDNNQQLESVRKHESWLICRIIKF